MKTEWTNHEITSLITMRSSGHSLTECAETLGRSKQACTKNFQKYATDAQKAKTREWDNDRRAVLASEAKGSYWI